jgi:hypothetical protein
MIPMTAKKLPTWAFAIKASRQIGRLALIHKSANSKAFPAPAPLRPMSDKLQFVDHVRNQSVEMMIQATN